MSAPNASVQICKALRWSDALATDAASDVALFRLLSEAPDLGAMMLDGTLSTDYVFFGSSETAPIQTPFTFDTIADRLSYYVSPQSLIDHAAHVYGSAEQHHGPEIGQHVARLELAHERYIIACEVGDLATRGCGTMSHTRDTRRSKEERLFACPARPAVIHHRIWTIHQARSAFEAAQTEGNSPNPRDFGL